MPDDRKLFDSREPTATWKEILPPLLMSLGAISLLRRPGLLALTLLGASLYDTASAADRDRRNRRAIERRIDIADEDSFPASDPPSFSGSTAGAP